ncbi:hypothetical protein B0H19DRAFT_1253244 [Mycena capillaripes]|nr:hypothetical protein B0H19DRAFT_1253244 [Mycena capillaripes]
MVPPPFVSAISLVLFCAGGCARAALVNRTIEDVSPLMQYNCTVLRCDVNSTNSSSCNFYHPEVINTTFTATTGQCQITIPFVGTAIYAFMACAFFQFEVDKTGSHPNIVDSGASHFPLTYFNNTLPNGTHTLVVTSPSEFGMFMDNVVYTVEDSVLTTQGTSSTTSTSASATSISLDNAPKPRADVRAVVGGALGGLVLISVLAIGVILFKRRAGRRKKWGRIFLGDPDLATRPSAYIEANPSGTVQHDNSVIRLEAQIRELQAQTAELRTALGTQPQRPPSEGTRLAAMKREIQAMRDYAPAVLPGDLVLHTDSGLRLTPARQIEELPPEYVEV